MNQTSDAIIVDKDYLIAVYTQLLQEKAQSDDTEVAHEEADDILCDLLKQLGFEAVVTEYHKVGKWYA